MRRMEALMEVVGDRNPSEENGAEDRLFEE